MAGLKVKDLAVAAVKGHAAAEYIPALEVADEEDLPVGGDVEALAVHLLMGDLKIFADALRDGVPGGDVPQSLPFAGLAPLQTAGASGDLTEDFREVPRVEDDQPHALQDSFVNPGHGLVRHFMMGGMSPPEHHVGIGDVAAKVNEDLPALVPHQALREVVGYKILAGIIDDESSKFVDVVTFATLTSYSSKKICHLTLMLFRHELIGKIFDPVSKKLYFRVTDKGESVIKEFANKHKCSFARKKQKSVATIVKIA